jgi:hypothetical protein
MGKNRTVQNNTGENLEIRMEEFIPLDYDDDSGLENDNDPHKVNKSSQIDPSTSNPPNSSNSETSKNFEKGNGDDGKNDVSRSRNGPKKTRNSSRNNQIEPIPPNFSENAHFLGSQPTGSDNDEREPGGKNTQVLPQSGSRNHKSPTKPGNAPIGKKGKPKLRPELSEGVDSAEALERAQASIATPQPDSQDDQEEPERLQSSDSNEDRDLTPVVDDDPGRNPKRKFSEGNELGNKAEDDKDTVHTSPNEPLSSRKSRKKGSAEDDKDSVHTSPNAPQSHLKPHSHGYGNRAGLRTPIRGRTSTVGPSNLFIPGAWMKSNPGHGPVRNASKQDIFFQQMREFREWMSRRNIWKPSQDGQHLDCLIQFLADSQQNRRLAMIRSIGLNELPHLSIADRINRWADNVCKYIGWGARWENFEGWVQHTDPREYTEGPVG